MFAKVHLACAVFSFSTFKNSLLVAMFMTLVGGENQSRLSGVQVYLVPSRSRLVSVIHWKAIFGPSCINKTLSSSRSFGISFLWAV